MQLKLLEVTWTDIGTFYANIAIAISVIIVVIMTNQYWHKQKKAEMSYERMLHAYMAVWKLLAYLSDMDNGKNIVSFEGRKDKKEYFFNTVNAKKYIEELRVIYFDEGCGLFLDGKIKDILFHTRFSLHKNIYRIEKNNLDLVKSKIEDEDFIKFMDDHYKELISHLNKVVKYKINYKD